MQRYVSIYRISGGSGMFGTERGDRSCFTAEEAFEIEGNRTLLELGKDWLPEGVEDIRGKIYDAPDRIFASVCDDGFGPLDVMYWGVDEIVDASDVDTTTEKLAELPLERELYYVSDPAGGESRIIEFLDSRKRAISEFRDWVDRNFAGAKKSYEEGDITQEKFEEIMDYCRKFTLRDSRGCEVDICGREG